MIGFLSERIFPALLNMSLTGSVVILAVLVIRVFLRKAPKKWSYLLWLVVAFRLVCPVSFAAPVSLMGAVRAPATTRGTIEYIPQIMVTPQTPAVSPGNPAPGLSIPGSVTPEPQIPLASDPVSTMDILAVVWLVGMAIMVIYSVASYLRLRRRLSCAILLNDNVWQSDRVQSPFILGLIRPRIYIPFGLDGQTLEYVLDHEHGHLNRGDHVIKPLAFLILALHWFNPLCWLAFQLMGRDMEMSCDEQVLALGNGDRKAYSTVLLSFAANRRFPAPSPLAFGEGEVRSRITNALNWNAPKVRVTAAAGVLCAAVLLLCALNPLTSRPSDPFGGYYRVSELTYTDPEASAFYHAGSELTYNDPAFYGVLPQDEIRIHLGEDHMFSILGNGWTIRAHYSLTKSTLPESFDTLFDDKGGVWSGGCTAAWLRENNRAVWFYLGSNASRMNSVYLLQQKDDSLYMLVEYVDEPMGSFSDYPLRRWVLKLERSDLSSTGTYASVQDFINQTMAAEKTAHYFKLGLPPRPDGGAATAEANVTGTRLEYLEKMGELAGLAPDGVLEAWESFYLLALDADPDQMGLAGGQYEQDGWYNLNGAFNVIALRHEDGSYDILGYEHQGGDNMDFKGIRSYEEALYDWYVKKYDLTDTWPLCIEEWSSSKDDGVTVAVRRYDGGDDWYIYLPIGTWVPSGAASWSSAYDTGAQVHISRSADTLSEELRQAQLKLLTVVNEGACYRIDDEGGSTFLYSQPGSEYAWKVRVVWNTDPEWYISPITIEREREELLQIARSFRTYSGRKGTQENAPAANPESAGQILGYYDFDHDGAAETAELVPHAEEGWYELLVKRADGTVLWTDEAHTAHAGYNSLFACILDGKHYLLQYNPVMYQGSCSYTYRLFSLDAQGNVLPGREADVSFDINWGMPYPYHQTFDAAEVADFLDAVNGLLASSRLLLNTDTALDDMDPEHPQDIPWWLRDESMCAGYVYDEGKSLRENLLALEQAVS